MRDLLHKTPVAQQIQDFDIATSATPEQVIALFGHTRTIPTGLQHGTVTVLLPVTSSHLRTKHDQVEVTTFRGENAYGDGRRPDHVVFLQDIENDLQRRDFTINAIAYDPVAHCIVDPFEGRKDLQRQLIRAVGIPAVRFQEDGLRLLRALRFSAQLGFRLEPATAQAVTDCLSMIKHISRERIREELFKTLGSFHVSKGLALLHHTGLLYTLMPIWASVSSEEMLRSIVRAACLPNDPLLRLAGWLETCYAVQPHETLQVLGQLALSTDQKTRIHAAWYVPSLENAHLWTPAQIRRFASTHSLRARTDGVALAQARLCAHGHLPSSASCRALALFQQRLQEELAAHPPLLLKDLALTGEEVAQVLQISPGKQIGVCLRWLLEQVLEDPSLNHRASLQALLLNKFHGVGKTGP